jgi:predicted membrane protein
MRPHCRHDRRRPGDRILFGIIAIVFGVVALLGNLGIFETRNILQFWPAIFIIVGTVKLARSRHAGGYLVGGAFAGTGLLMMLNNAGIISFHLRDWWPAFLILGGVLIVFKGMRRGGQASDGVRAGEEGEDVMHGSRVDTSAILSGAKIKSDTQDFRGGELTAVMGGIDLDLRQASIQEEATLRVFALMGGIAIKVPADWSIVVNAVPVLGGVDDRTVPPMNPGKRLVIEGEAILGGIELRN